MNNELVELLKLMFVHMIRIKMYHFQCPKYSQHKISDAYYDKYNTKFDNFFEMAQGIYGRFTITNLKLPSFDLCPKSIVVHLDNFIVLMRSLDNVLDNKELLTIRDDMINDVFQLKYLLTFS